MITEPRTKLLLGCYEAIRQYGEDVIKINNRLMSLDKNVDEVLADLAYVCDKESGDGFTKVKETINDVLSSKNDLPLYEKVLFKTRMMIEALDTHLSDVWEKEYKEQMKKSVPMMLAHKTRLEKAFNSFQKDKRFSSSYKKSLDVMSEEVSEIGTIMLGIPVIFQKGALVFPSTKLGLLISDLQVLCNQYNSDKGLTDKEQDMVAEKEPKVIEMLTEVLPPFLEGSFWIR